LAFWYDAALDPRGIYLKSGNVMQLKSILYTARAKSGDPDLFKLSIRTSPSDPRNELWIVHIENPEVAE
jgi:hypothetical protein